MIIIVSLCLCPSVSFLFFSLFHSLSISLCICLFVFLCHSLSHFLWRLVKVSPQVIFTPPRNRGGVMFSLQFVCVSVCQWVCPMFSCEQNSSSRTDEPIWSRFSVNGCLPHWLKPYSNLDIVFAKWLFPALTWTLLKLVTLGQRSRSQWRNIHFFFIILC